MSKYSTFVFDLDGTLLDTLGDLAASTNYALRQHGLPERSLDEVRRFVGNGVKVLMERAVPSDFLDEAKHVPGSFPAGRDASQFEAVLQTFREHYLHHALDTTQPYPGIAEMLSELKRRGCRLAVVSNKFQTATKELCQHFFADTIDVAIGEHEAQGIRRKPEPDTVYEALRQLHVDSHSRDSTVYVGDSEVDVATARNAFLPCISVLWGFRDRQLLTDHGATVFVETPEQLLDFT